MAKLTFPLPFDLTRANATAFSLTNIANVEGVWVGGSVLDIFYFYAPRTSSITQTRGAGTPTETRATVATVMGYAADAVLADGQTLLTVASGELRFQGARRVSEGVWSNVDADGAPIPAATLNGAVVEAAATQYLGVTGTPATQTTASLGTGTYTLWVEGTGSALASAGTATISGEAAATEGSHNTFTVSGAGTVTVTVTGSLTFFQLENSPYPTHRIDNAGAVGTSATRNKDVLDDQVASNLSAAAGTVAFTWTPSHDPSGTVALCGSYVDASNYTALLHDATKYIWRKRIAGVNYDAELTAAYANGTSAKIALTLGASGINLAVDGTLGTADTTGIEGVQYGKLPGTAGAYFSTPDSVANSITGDISIVMKFAPTTVSGGGEGELVSKMVAGAGQRAYQVNYSANNGTILYYWSENGTATTTKTSSAAFTVANAAKYIAVTHDVDNGAAGSDVKFWTSTDGSSWNQLGATQTTAGVATIFDSTSAIGIGGAGDADTAGNYYRVQIYNGIPPMLGGADSATPVVDFNPADYTHGTTWTSSATGEVYTINGNAAVWPAVKLGTRWQWGADGNGGQQAGAAFKEKYLTTKALSDALLISASI